MGASSSNLPHQSNSVLVSGASSGIGLSTACLLSQAGFFVYAGVRTRNDVRHLESLGNGFIKAVQLDLRSDSDIDAIRDLIESSRDAPLVSIVNNAGICVTHRIEQSSRAELLEMFEVNAIGHAVLSSAFLPLLRESGGKVVFIGSISSVVPSAHNGAYCSAKAAQQMLFDVMRVECAANGVSFISIQPGVVATPFWKKIADLEMERELQQRKGLNSLSDTMENRLQMLRHFAESGHNSAESVAATILKAIKSKNPKYNYVVGSDGWRRLLIYKILPKRLYTHLAARKLGAG
jgi:NAD(P)-dependent dehydrogenase (short-subunit alcohol dehydrogenase family)